jgi:Fic family protein
MISTFSGGQLRSFASLDRLLDRVPRQVVMPLSRIDTGRGREELYLNQLPGLVTELATRARIASITASSALEGVIVADQVRAAKIIDGSAPVLRNRSEREFAGYRAALDYLFTEDWKPLNVGLLLHLHRELFSKTEAKGGTFKDDDNLVVDRSPDGTVEVRFVPVPAAWTEHFTTELVDRYNEAVVAREHHPVLLIGLFVLDLLTIHPFADGNGRVVRALTNALLADAGYTIGRFVSIEQLIAESADDYYRALWSPRTAGTKARTTRGRGWRTSWSCWSAPSTGSSSAQRRTVPPAPSRTGSESMS